MAQQATEGPTECVLLRLLLNVAHRYIHPNQQLTLNLPSKHSGHQLGSDSSTAEGNSCSVEAVCNICEMPYHRDDEQEFTFCCDRPIGAHCYQTVLDEGMECPYCGQNVQPKETKPQYILRFGHRIAAEASVTPETTGSIEDENSSPENSSPYTSTEEPPHEHPPCTRVQVFLLDSFARFIEDVRVFDEDALTEEQKLAMVKKLEMQLGLRA